MSYYPLTDEFGYSVRSHAWLLNGEPVSEEEAERLYGEDADRRIAERLASDPEWTEKVLREMDELYGK